ncbi:hypothetical protein INT47_004198 [Mucor saturninus]|uniref:Uncharacterized protein n=1 Tax=Mucor saturninus TaxID=64648 RepID=A0A8H7QM79_9FUNG|nr:hypothetical protein INT47_004198 [Mucor saturninus]
MRLQYYISSFSCILTCVIAAQHSLINCTWPCPTSTHGCIVTPQGASCSDKGINEWVINSPEKAPIYTGAYVSVALQACQPVPIPKLPAAFIEVNTTQIGQSIIMWPILNMRRPQDEYLGNCGHGFYCSSTGEDQLKPVCRQRFVMTSTCFSSNQCLSGSCLENTCQYNSNRTDGGRRHRYTESHNDYDDRRTARILASIFGIVGGIIVLVVGFIMYRRRQIRKAAVNEAVYPNETGQQSTLSFGASGLPLRANDSLHKQFASDFQNDGATSTITSVMQQSQLHHDIPPPSYKP